MSQLTGLVTILSWIFILKVGIIKASQMQNVAANVVPLLAQANLGQTRFDQPKGTRSPVDQRVRFDQRACQLAVADDPSVARFADNKLIRKYHDIFNMFVAPHKLAFGHVEQRPDGFEQRFESLNNGNRYKGEVKWGDGSGAYGENSWNLVQGKL